MTDHELARYAAFDTAPQLETERLILRAHRLEDFAALADIFQTDRAKFMGGPLSRERVWTMFSDSVGQWPLCGMGTWAVVRRADGVVVGEVGINRPAHFPEPELGWLLYDGFEGQGFATEAAGAALDFAAGTYKLQSLVSYIDPDNARSIQVARRLGGVNDPKADTPNDEPCLVYRHDLRKR